METAIKALELAISLNAFLRQIVSDPDKLAEIVQAARAQGREVDATDVKATIDGMDAAGAKLAALIAAKS